MKKLYALFFLLAAFSLKSQTNLVPNPSFEIADTCPNTNAYIYYAHGWSTTSYNYPSYFNSCTTNPYFSVPDNLAGYQYAASGNAYAGLTCYSSVFSAPSGSELMGVQLISPLQIGQKYYVKFKLNCAMGDGINTAIDKVGIRFTNVLHNPAHATPINNTAHVYATTIVSDTTNWTVISGVFIADSAYNYLEAGNFFDYSHINKQIIYASGGANSAFYYMDDICVSTDSLYTNNWTWNAGINEYAAQKTPTIYPNPSTGKVFIKSGISNAKTEIKVYDIYSNEIKNIKINADNTIVEFEESGVYFISITNGPYKIVKKIIINK